jgi:hypothetical protein
MTKTEPNIPMMSPDDERLMAFIGLIQWAQCVIAQAKRVSETTERLKGLYTSCEFDSKSILALHCEHHFFVIAAYKLIEHREWIKKFDLCKKVDFSEIDSFSSKDIKDLRNMREHIVEYFQGDGRDKNRWITETPEYQADASSCVGTMIGGRLDYIAFAKATERLLFDLQKEPIPYSPHEF